MIQIILLIAVGIYLICASTFQWEWFFSNRKAQRLVDWIGYKNTRIVYSVLGLAMILISIMIYLEN
ncbi:Imm17 family immunity protein [Fusibacter sp. JL216-2]|uniref:Imm17 family immunity protein n=1 Tax=Fusibacter sp. JL216-2 TaxID=3071453 RepID=UPI003D3585B4